MDPIWKRRGFDSQEEFDAYLAELYGVIKKDRTQGDTIVQLGDYGNKEAITAYLDSQRGAVPATPAPVAQRSVAAPVAVRPGETETQYQQFARKMEDVQEKEVQQAQYDPAKLPDRVIEDNTLRLYVDAAQEPRDAAKGDRISQAWDWLMTPASPETPGILGNTSEPAIITALRPQPMLTAEETKAYEDARSKGDTTYFVDKLLDVAGDKDTKGRTVESTIGYAARMANIPSAFVTYVMDSALSSGDPTPFSERVAKGEGLAEGSRELASYLEYGTRDPMVGDKLADGSEVPEGWSLPEQTAFVAGGLVDLLIPGDLGIAGAVKGASKASKVLKAADTFSTIEKAGVIAEGAVKGGLESWPGGARLLSSTPELQTSIISTAAKRAEPVVQEWKDWAINPEIRRTNPAPESAAKMGLPTDPDEAYDFLGRAIAMGNANPNPIPLNERIGRIALGRKALTDASGLDARIGDVLVHTNSLPELRKSALERDMGHGLTLGEVRNLVTLTPDEALQMDGMDYKILMDHVRESKAVLRMDPATWRKLEAIDEATGLNYPGPKDPTPDASAYPKVKVDPADWNQMMVALMEQHALDFDPTAVDLRSIDFNRGETNLTLPAEMRTPADAARKLASSLRLASLDASTDLEKVASPAVLDAIQRNKLKLGAVGESILDDIKIARKAGDVNPVSGLTAKLFQTEQDVVRNLDSLLSRLYGDQKGLFRTLASTPNTRLNVIAGALRKKAIESPGDFLDTLNRFVALLEKNKAGAMVRAGDLEKAGLSPINWQIAMAAAADKELASNPMAVAINLLVEARKGEVLSQAAADILARIPKKSAIYRDIRRWASDTMTKVESEVAKVFALSRDVEIIPGSNVASYLGENEIPIRENIAQFIADAAKAAVLDDTQYFQDAFARFQDRLIASLENQDIYAFGILDADRLKELISDSVLDIQDSTAELAQRVQTEFSKQNPKALQDQVRQSAADSLAESLQVIYDLQSQADYTTSAVQRELTAQLVGIHPVVANAIAEELLRLGGDVVAANKDIIAGLGGVSAVNPLADTLVQAGINPKDLVKVIMDHPEIPVSTLARQVQDITGSLSAHPLSGLKRAGKRLSGLARQGMLGGYLIPNFAYHTANILTAPAIMTATVGGQLAWAATKRTGYDLVSKVAAKISAGELVKFVYARLGMTPTVPGKNILLNLEDGRVYTYDSIAKIALQNGILGGQQSAEFQVDVLDSILRWSKRNLKGEKVGGGQDFLRRNLDPLAETYAAQIAAASDGQFRTSVLIEALASGKSEEDAVKLARESLFDYNKISEAEQNYIASWYWFYRFQRQNVVSTMRNMVMYPNRVKQLLQIQSMPSRMFDERNMSEDQKQVFIYSNNFESRAKLATFANAAKNSFKDDVQVYGPPMPLSDAILAIQGGMQIFKPLQDSTNRGPEGITATMTNILQTAGSHAGPGVGTMFKFVTGDQALAFGEVQNLGKSVDPKFVAALKSTGFWDSAKEYFQIVETHPGNPDYPTGRAVNQMEGDAYYYLGGTKDTRLAWHALTNDATTAAGVHRLVTDFVGPLVMYAGDEQGMSQNVIPTLGNYPSEIAAIRALKFLGAIQVEESTVTEEEQSVTGGQADQDSIAWKLMLQEIQNKYP